jgi:hypothetical protein
MNNTFSATPPSEPTAIDAALVKELARAKEKPIAVRISDVDIRMLFVLRTPPDQYMQLILAKLKDAGCTAVEGSIFLKLTHGQVYKLKTDPHKEQDYFEYLWLPPEYVYSLTEELQRGALA